MVTTEEIASAVKRLMKGGIWAQERNAPDEAQLGEYPDGMLFRGAGSLPEFISFGNDIARFENDMFWVQYFDRGARYNVSISIGQIGIPIKTSEHLDDIVTAIIHYFRMKAANIDSKLSVIDAIFWLQHAGAAAEIVSPTEIYADFKPAEYTLRLYPDVDYVNAQWVIVTPENESKNKGTGSLQDTLFSVLTRHIKLLSEKHENS